MKRPVVLIVGAAAGALLVAAIGASAHTGLSLTKALGVHSSVLGEEATGARVETPEPTETSEALPKAEPKEVPKTTETDTDTETNDESEANDETGAADATKTVKVTTKSTNPGEHEGSGHGDGEHKGSGGD